MSESKSKLINFPELGYEFFDLYKEYVKSSNRRIEWMSKGYLRDIKNGKKNFKLCKSKQYVWK